MNETTIEELRHRIERLDRSLYGDVGPLQDLLHLILNRIEALELAQTGAPIIRTVTPNDPSLVTTNPTPENT